MGCVFDNKSTKINFKVCSNKFTYIIDNGNGMNKNNCINCVDAYRVNHENDKSIGFTYNEWKLFTEGECIL